MCHTLARFNLKLDGIGLKPALHQCDPSVYSESAVRSLKTLWARASGIPQILLAVWLFVCAASQTFPTTPTGVQCPTAPVQSVSVAIKDCCGKVIGHVTRAPKLGEKGFLQCRCAEKKAPKQDSAATAPRFEVFTSSPVCLVFPSAIPPVRESFRYIAAASSAENTPATPPPDAA